MVGSHVLKVSLLNMHVTGVYIDFVLLKVRL